MAYNFVPQDELDRLSDNGRESPASPTGNVYKPIDLDHKNWGGETALKPAEGSYSSMVHRIGSYMGSSNSNHLAYEELEADEYDEDIGHAAIDRQKQPDRRSHVKHIVNATSSESAAPFRTASVSHALPMRSPRPDLQDMHDGVGNVERLEETADRMGASTSIEEKMEMLNLKQQRSERSLTSHYQASLRHQSSPMPTRAPKRRSPDRTVHYPAPVPAMLHPQRRLSNFPSATNLERRGLQRSALPSPDPRGSTARSSGVESIKQNQISSLPPQLRASIFFERTGRRLDSQTKEGSTSASFLDASADDSAAPFVDKPINGRSGSDMPDELRAGERIPIDMQKAENEGPANIRTSRAGHRKLMRKIFSKDFKPLSRPLSASRGPDEDDQPTNSDADTTPSQQEDSKRKADDPTTRAEDNASEQGDDDDDKRSSDEANARKAPPDFINPPATLLEELELRKALQKKRNRTAAAMLPNGRHTTLLEQDAIARIQKQARKQKHITLAWEDPDEADKANFSDEDVPLGVLYAGTKMVERATYPMGLLERRLMEDNEPLSRRRARLRGEQPVPDHYVYPNDNNRNNYPHPLYPSQLRSNSAQATYLPPPPPPPPPPPRTTSPRAALDLDSDSATDAETLAERGKRLKAAGARRHHSRRRRPEHADLRPGVFRPDDDDDANHANDDDE